MYSLSDICEKVVNKYLIPKQKLQNNTLLNYTAQNLPWIYLFVASAAFGGGGGGPTSLEKNGPPATQNSIYVCIII